MSEYEALERFDLREHGDHWEKELWGFVEEAFPAYEVFWRRYVVPLTNRIKPTIGPPEWIRLRSEIKSGNSLERMTMHHYSVFYFLARARKRICEDKPLPLPEDVFSLLDACRDNILHFFQAIGIIYTFSKPSLGVPTDEGDLCRVCPTLASIKGYRNTILHNPVLGRRADREREFLPKREFLARVEDSWREAERLKGDEVVDSHELYEQLYRDLTAFLEKQWREIIGCLDANRNSSKFRTIWNLEPLLPIVRPPQITLGLLLPPVASPVATVIMTISSSSATFVASPSLGDNKEEDGV
jgi:hypothetical protein